MYINNVTLKLFDIANNQTFLPVVEPQRRSPAFFLAPSSDLAMFDLLCQADSYPRPSKFVWFRQNLDNVEEVGAGERLALTNEWFGQVWCQAKNDKGHLIGESTRVMIKMACEFTDRFCIKILIDIIVLLKPILKSATLPLLVKLE